MEPINQPINQKERMDRMYAAVTRINSIYDRYARQHGLSTMEWQTFYILLQEHSCPMTQRMLCDRLKATKSTVNSIVKKYISQGLLLLEEKPDNHKEKNVTLTPAGVDFARRVALPVMEAEMRVMQQITDEELDALLKAEGTFAEGLEQSLFV